MTDQEKLEFCGKLCMAAAKCGMVLHESNETETGKAFQFFDPATHILIKGKSLKDRKDALLSVCENLVSYFTLISNVQIINNGP